MAHIFGDVLAETELMEVDQQPRYLKSRIQGMILDFLSGLLVAGTIGLGLLFGILFINPQSSLNPLPPATKTARLLASSPSSTPVPVLPATGTAVPPTAAPDSLPPVSPTESRAVTPTGTPAEITASASVVPDPPLPVIQKVAVPAAHLESSVSLNKRNDVFSPEMDPHQAIARCSVPGIPDQVKNKDGPPAGAQQLPRLSPPQVAAGIIEPIPIERFQFVVLPSEEGISDIFTPEIQYWEEEILDWAEVYKIDPNLIATVMQIESCGYTRAKSAAGALGLFQVMPHHFKDDEDSYDPDINAYRGLRWLQKTLKSGGTVKLALAYYNAGIARIRNPYLGWPAETERYVFWGLNIYQDTRCGYDSSAALDHWLSKGGSALCNRAAGEQLEK